jgi:hypothetical protein
MFFVKCELGFSSPGYEVVTKVGLFCGMELNLFQFIQKDQVILFRRGLNVDQLFLLLGPNTRERDRWSKGSFNFFNAKFFWLPNFQVENDCFYQPPCAQIERLIVSHLCMEMRGGGKVWSVPYERLMHLHGTLCMAYTFFVHFALRVFSIIGLSPNRFI